jgi:hypothetical protein
MKHVATVTIALMAGIALFAAAGPEQMVSYQLVAPEHGSTIVYEQHLEPEITVLELVGNRNSSMDFYVYDDAGNLLVSGTGVTVHTRIAFTPRAGGNYRIVLRNAGRDTNEYC